MTLETLMDEIRALPVEERKRLIGMIVDTIDEPEAQLGKRIPGLFANQGSYWMSDDFDDPLPDSFWFGNE